jgi:hypothetical protein
MALSNNLSVGSPGFEALLGSRMERSTFRRWVELLVVRGSEHAVGQIFRPAAGVWVRFDVALLIPKHILGSFLEF